jgi:hypothetical protein
VNLSPETHRRRHKLSVSSPGLRDGLDVAARAVAMRDMAWSPPLRAYKQVPDQAADEAPVIALELLVIDPVDELPESVQRALESCRVTYAGRQRASIGRPGGVDELSVRSAQKQS